MKIVATQGGGRYLIDLETEGSLAQIADTRTGQLWPPRLIHSIVARGYWEPLAPDETPSLAEILNKVQPV